MRPPKSKRLQAVAVDWIKHEPEQHITEGFQSEYQDRWGATPTEKTHFPKGVAFCWTHGCPRFSVRWSWKGQIFTLALLEEGQGCAAAMLADCAKVWFGPWRLRGEAGRNLNFDLTQAESLIATCPRIRDWLGYCEQILVEEFSLPSREQLGDPERVKEKRMTVTGELAKELGGRLDTLSSQIGELTKKTDAVMAAMLEFLKIQARPVNPTGTIP